MMTDQRPTSPLRIRLTHPVGGNTGTHRTTLRVTDAASLIVIAEMDLTPEQVVELISNREVEVTAAIPGPLGHSRLFRQRQNEHRMVPPEIGDKWTYGQDPEVTRRVDEWAARIKADEGWDSAVVDTRSQSFFVRLLRWLPWEDSANDEQDGDR